MVTKELVRYYDVPDRKGSNKRTNRTLKTGSVMDDNFRPSKIISLLFVLLLVLIHAVDMQLTRHYIGNDWQRETFIPMSLCIKYFGIHISLWISRLCVYPLLFLYFMNWKKRCWHYFLITSTLLYWTAMLSWLDTLGIIKWL
jgi:hypothetical protein